MKILSRIERLEEFLKENSQPQYRLNQILRSIFKSKVKHYSEIKNIPKSLKLKLTQSFPGYISSLRPIETQQDKSGLTVWFKTSDNSVIMTHLTIGTKTSILNLSSQAGCAFSCKFCPAGSKGYLRQLTVDEIIDQILYFHQNENKFESIYFSGMGEPLGNPNLFRALSIIRSSEYFGISSRRIRISTIGILPGLKKLNLEFPQVNLDFSLHNPLSEERSSIIPVNKLYPIDEVFELLDQRLQIAKRRICVNYMLIPGVNDTKLHAKALIELLKSRKFATRHLYYLRIFPRLERDSPNSFSSDANHEFFKAILSKNKINLVAGKFMQGTIQKMIDSSHFS